MSKFSGSKPKLPQTGGAERAMEHIREMRAADSFLIGPINYEHGYYERTGNVMRFICNGNSTTDLFLPVGLTYIYPANICYISFSLGMYYGEIEVKEWARQVQIADGYVERKTIAKRIGKGWK